LSDEQPCSECRGAGRVVEERSVEVTIPPGIHHGQRIRLTGEGHAGVVGGRAGDVYLEVRIRPDERLVREGDDSLQALPAPNGRRQALATASGPVESTASRPVEATARST